MNPLLFGFDPIGDIMQFVVLGFILIIGMFLAIILPDWRLKLLVFIATIGFIYLEYTGRINLI